MHFQVIYDIFSNRCSKSIVDEIDRIFYEIRISKLKSFSPSIIKKLKSFLTEEQFAFILKEMEKNLIVKSIFEILCPNCGKAIEKFSIGSIKSLEELIGCTSYCSSCNEDFTVSHDDVVLRYSVEIEFLSL